MDSLIPALVLIVVALVGARVSFSTERAPAGPRLLFRTGTHFLLVGFALGPSGLNLLTPAAMGGLFPFLALGLGWVGFHFGLQLERDTLRHFHLRYHAFAAGQAALTFLLFAGGAYVLIRLTGLQEDLVPLLVLAAASTAAITTPAGIAMISSNFQVKGKIRDLLLFVGSVDALVGIVALQVTYSVYRPDATGAMSSAGDFLAAMTAAVSLGLVCGILFLWLTRSRPKSEELVLYLGGICAFAAGAALQWGLSPLFVSVTMGALVANLGQAGARVRPLLERWEKTVYVTFLLLAGALLEMPTWLVLPLALTYAGLRFASKVAGASIMTRALSFDFEVPRPLGLGLIPQGGISIAMAVSGVLMYSDLRVGGYDAEAILFGVIVIGVVISELTGPVLTLALLHRAGEISPEALGAPASSETGDLEGRGG